MRTCVYIDIFSIIYSIFIDSGVIKDSSGLVGPLNTEYIMMHWDIMSLRENNKFIRNGMETAHSDTIKRIIKNIL